MPVSYYSGAVPKRPPNVNPIDDNGTRYVSGFEVPSDSTMGKWYKVYFDRAQDCWVCECKGNVNRGDCRHLKRHQLEGRTARQQRNATTVTGKTPTVKLLGNIDLLGTVYRPGTLLNANAFQPESLAKLLERGLVEMFDGAPPKSREDAPGSTKRPAPDPRSIQRPLASQRRPGARLTGYVGDEPYIKPVLIAPKKAVPLGPPPKLVSAPPTKSTGIRRIALDEEV